MEEKRRQAIDFKEAACCPSAIVQGHHGEKTVCVRKCPGKLGPSARPTAISTQPKQGQESHHQLRQLLIGAVILASLIGAVILASLIGAMILASSQYFALWKICCQNQIVKDFNRRLKAKFWHLPNCSFNENLS